MTMYILVYRIIGGHDLTLISFRKTKAADLIETPTPNPSARCGVVVIVVALSRAFQKAKPSSRSSSSSGGGGRKFEFGLLLNNKSAKKFAMAMT